MFNGKMKAVTFSYDDGITQDRRLIEIFDKYGLKCTFNINSKLLGHAGKLERFDNVTIAHVKPRIDEIASIYKNHEIASHTLTHPTLNTRSHSEIIKEVERDRLALSEAAGYEVVGFAYPGGASCINEEVIDIVRNETGVKYARTTTTTGNFELPEDYYNLKPSVYHLDFDLMMQMGRDFIALQPDSPKLFYIWGHAYEFDAIPHAWDRIEEFCALISGKPDIFYGTNTQCLL